MALLTLVLASIGIGLGVATLAMWIVEARRRVHPAVRHRVLVNLDEGAVRGFLVSQRGEWIVLQHAEWLQADGQRAPLDGDLVLERRRVQFLQMLPTT